MACKEDFLEPIKIKNKKKTVCRLGGEREKNSRRLRHKSRAVAWVRS